MTVEIAKLAVETGMWTLFEYEEGESRTTYKPKQMLPVSDYLKLQGRFRHMNDEDIKTLQRWLCEKWYQNYGHEIEEPVCAIFKPEEMKMHHDKDDLHVF